MKILAENKKAFFDYEFIEKYEAGLVLLGPEVKSIKIGRININAAFVSLRGNELFLINCNIPPYQANNMPGNYDPERYRKLLVTSQEIKYLTGKLAQKGLTLVPIKVYTKKSKIKLEFGLGKSKRKVNKRQDLKNRDIQRDTQRSLQDY